MQLNDARYRMMLDATDDATDDDANAEWCNWMMLDTGLLEQYLV